MQEKNKVHPNNKLFYKTFAGGIRTRPLWNVRKSSLNHSGEWTWKQQDPVLRMCLYVRKGHKIPRKQECTELSI